MLGIKASYDTDTDTITITGRSSKITNLMLPYIVSHEFRHYKINQSPMIKNINKTKIINNIFYFIEEIYLLLTIWKK